MKIKNTTKNGIKEFIQQREINNFRFVPNSNFYKTIKIGQKRWGQIFRNEKPVTVEELKRIAKFFDVNINEFLLNK